MDICWQIKSLLFNMLFRFVITFLPRSKCLLISWLQSPSAVILEPQNIKSLFPLFPHGGSNNIILEIQMHPTAPGINQNSTDFLTSYMTHKNLLMPYSHALSTLPFNMNPGIHHPIRVMIFTRFQVLSCGRHYLLCQ